MHMLNCSSRSFPLSALVALLACSQVSMASPLASGSAPGAPSGNGCIGYAPAMPPAVVHQLNAVNEKWILDGRDSFAAFQRHTGQLGIAWERAVASATASMQASMNKLNAKDKAFKQDFYRGAQPQSSWTEQQRRDFDVEAARFSLESMTILDRLHERVAQATLEFALAGGNTEYVNIYNRDTKTAFDECRKAGAAIYARWRAARRLPASSPSTSTATSSPRTRSRVGQTRARNAKSGP